MNNDKQYSEAWVEHEVKLRVHESHFVAFEKRMDEAQARNDKRFDKLDAKLNSILGILITGFLIPVALKYFGLN